MKRILLIVFLSLLLIAGCSAEAIAPPEVQEPALSESEATERAVLPQTEETQSAEDDAELLPPLEENQAYYEANDVADYLIEFGHLPPNYLTKSEARDLGWIAEDGNLWDVTDKGVIGGDTFGNREGLLPKAKGRKYYEADVNYNGGRRGADRLVFSNDGLIFYTQDHYDSFEDWTPEE